MSSRRTTSIATDSFSPIRRNKISCVPASASKNHFSFSRTNGTGNGQFSAPMYSTHVPSNCRTNRCISLNFAANCLRAALSPCGSREKTRSYLINGFVAGQPQNGCNGMRRKVMIWLNFHAFILQVPSFPQCPRIYANRIVIIPLPQLLYLPQGPAMDPAQFRLRYCFSFLDLRRRS
jgi:hypothetical protein